MKYIFFIPILSSLLSATILADTESPDKKSSYFFQNPELTILKTSVNEYLKNSWCSNEKASLLIDLIASERPNVCVEIGVFTGSSTLPILATLKSLKHGKLIAIDSWSNNEATKNLEDTDPNKTWWAEVDMPSVKNTFYQMLRSWALQPYCKIIQKSSLEAVDEVGDIDFLHLDGDYSEKGSLEDVAFYLPKVKSNGYILVSNLHVFINNKHPRKKAFALLFKSCKVICRIEDGNAVLLKKI